MRFPYKLKEDAPTDACGERVDQPLPLWQFLTQICSTEDPTDVAAYSVQQLRHAHTWGRCRTANVFSPDTCSAAHPYTVPFNADASEALDFEDGASGWHTDADRRFLFCTARSKK